MRERRERGGEREEREGEKEGERGEREGREGGRERERDLQSFSTSSNSHRRKSF